MPLAPGARLGAYGILSPIGSGGIVSSVRRLFSAVTVHLVRSECSCVRSLYFFLRPVDFCVRSLFFCVRPLDICLRSVDFFLRAATIWAGPPTFSAVPCKRLSGHRSSDDGLSIFSIGHSTTDSGPSCCAPGRST